MAAGRLSTPGLEGRWSFRLRRGLRREAHSEAPLAVVPVMAGSNPWEPLQPTAAGGMLARCLAVGLASQEVLDICGKPAPCLIRLSVKEKIADIRAKLGQTNLELEFLQTEKDTADITHPFYLTQKCQALKMMNSHLEALLKEKRALRQRLAKPLCQESLPIEAIFHRYAVELLALAVAFIEKLEAHLTTVRSIPQLPLTMKNMDSTLEKVDLLVTETEKLAEQILQWKAKRNDIFSDNSRMSVGSDSCFRSITLE
ncbi:HAUS augmin-like complex subunit 2 [Tiliqua scincoides]|uniref:HAUS augmin-like complex subunit 2 n=1 Tax=Tiliqua scincoides TaxID=71010 RepID=UPI00346358A7